MARSQGEVMKKLVILNAVVAAMSVAGFVCVFFIESHWDKLMKASHFGSWPSVTGLGLICLGLGGTYGTSTVIGSLHKRWQLKTLLIASTVTFLFSVVGLSGIITSGCPDMTPATALSPQIDPVATFNRGVCTAWCHTRDPTSVAEMAETCGAKADPAFESLITKPTSNKIASWCEQAILRDSFSAKSLDKGMEPFSTLTQDVDVCLPVAWLALVAVVAAVIVSMALATEILIIEALVRKSRATTAVGEPEDKVNESLVPATVSV